MRTPDPEELSVEELFMVVREKALALGITSQEEYGDVVDETLQEKMNTGILDSQDGDLETLARDLRRKWRDLEGEVASTRDILIAP
jgi:hypothetical protein